MKLWGSSTFIIGVCDRSGIGFSENGWMLGGRRTSLFAQRRRTGWVIWTIYFACYRRTLLACRRGAVMVTVERRRCCCCQIKNRTVKLNFHASVHVTDEYQPKCHCCRIWIFTNNFSTSMALGLIIICEHENYIHFIINMTFSKRPFEYIAINEK